MFQVHKGVHKATGKDYAIKVIDKTSLSSHEKSLLRGEIGKGGSLLALWIMQSSMLLLGFSVSFEAFYNRVPYLMPSNALGGWGLGVHATGLVPSPLFSSCLFLLYGNGML